MPENMPELRIYGIARLLDEGVSLAKAAPANADLIAAVNEYAMAVTDFAANGYNAAVNYASERGHRKMGDFIDAINRQERAEGALELEILKVHGLIESYKPCSLDCHMRPGGLFHVEHCENDFNSEVARKRRDAVRDRFGDGLRYSPSLVGLPNEYLPSRHWSDAAKRQHERRNAA